MFYQRLYIFLNFRKCFRGFTEPLARRKPNALEDYQKRLFGLTEAFLWIGLRRAEGSTSCRALAVSTLRARCFSKIEGKIQLNQRKRSVESRERVSKSEGEIGLRRAKVQQKQRRELHEADCSAKTC